MDILKPTFKISEKEILTNFSFLQSDFGFPKFKKKWTKDEYYITTQKADIEFSTTIFKFDSSAPIIGITNHSEPIVFNHEIYPTNFYWIHNLDETGGLKMITENGRDFVEIYISECAKLLKAKPKILNGITTDFKKNKKL
ncbi:MAG: hypothetical protein CL868_05230 [Cytophagaceae bacterium]|nr:hypothetical protein [Cytophagaceae bacterium]|tara:strand:- start:15045 stop:15464 length:420 start_codon:yes stop_codon:yes gene_type:complete